MSDGIHAWWHVCVCSHVCVINNCIDNFYINLLKTPKLIRGDDIRPLRINCLFELTRRTGNF